MSDGYVVGTIDVAEIALVTFTLFFIALIFWLRREDRREGYPMEDELTGAIESAGGVLHSCGPKAFVLPFDRGVATTPTKGREPVEIAAKRAENFSGSGLVPTGNPLTDGIGPAAYAQRAAWPDQDAHGRPRIVPLAIEPNIAVAREDADPRGMPVIAADGAVAGTVSDLWVDRADHLVRYLDIATEGGGRALAPMAMAKVTRGGIVLDAINAADFAGAPLPAAADQITRLEEERIVGYFGGGYLYANAGRQEPWL